MTLSQPPENVGWFDLDFPEPEFDAIAPQIPSDVYADRLTAARAAMDAHGLDYLVVYADREHFASLAFMTGYDPRFEESLLIIGREGTPTLLVGNEGLAYAGISKLPVEVLLCQTLSLQGQPRGSSATLASLLSDIGLTSGMQIGLVGTKYFTSDEVDDPLHATDVPAFVTDLLRRLVGAEHVINATALFTHPETGLRSHLTVHDLAFFEQATMVSYAGVRRMLTGLTLGMSEQEAAALFGYSGWPPLSYHIALGFGQNAVMGLGSPTPWTRLELGDYVSCGLGVWGGNVARAGLAVTGEGDLPAGAEDFEQALAIPYFRCLKDWYESLHIGVTGGEVLEAVRWFTSDPAMGVTLNPGHLLHLDEWPNTPFFADSPDRLLSGTALQCDIIAAPGAPMYGIHSEDSLVLADGALRAELAALYPNVAARCMRRQQFLRETLGIQIADDVLPLSDLTGVVHPYLLRPTRALCVLH